MESQSPAADSGAGSGSPRWRAPPGPCCQPTGADRVAQASVGVARPGARDLMVHTQGHGFRWGAGSSALHCAQRVTARGPACPAHRGRRVPLGLGAPEVSVEGAAVHFSSKDRLAPNPQGARAAGQALSVRAMRLHTPQVRGQGSGVQAETHCACAGPGNAAVCPVRSRRSPRRTAPLYCADVRAAQRSRGGRGRGGGECGSGAGFFEPKTRLGPEPGCSGEGGSSRSAWRWAWKY